ncbi:MAG: lysophospholipase [Bacteroidales bacterium]|jgi:alpha-beta hydrolase superfamily lysophospholipase|nr:lysophospholipase [Bacteroidales bacterium]MDD4214926.1 lysophospholipase [Bacteroidales bacterium]
MEQNNFTISSEDNIQLFVYSWLPDDMTSVKGVFQIVHGKAEHAGRYHDFASYLTNHSFAVFAGDLRGHGKTAGNVENTGFIAKKNGWKLILSDLLVINNHIQNAYPGKPLILLGHSMGSFYSRAYTDLHPDTVSAVILSGTAWQPLWLLNFGLLVAKLQIIFKGHRNRSRLLEFLSTGKLNNRFKPVQTPFDWLCSNPETCKKYKSDPYCGYDCTSSLFTDLFHVLKYIQKPSLYSKTQKNIPILIFSGAMDGVGDFSKGPIKFSNFLKEKNFSNVTLKLYPDGRHEMLNEKNKEEVYSDVVTWTDTNISSHK